MSRVLGLLSLLIALGAVGALAKRQLGAASVPSAAPARITTPAEGGLAAPQQRVQQVRQAVQESMQARPLPDDTQ